MCLTVEFLDYQANRPKARLVSSERPEVRETKKPESSEDLMKQFASLQLVMPASANGIPEEARKKIRWAEEQLAKRGLN